MEFACLQHMDMIKLQLGFGEFDRISELLQKQHVKLKPKKSLESFLDGFSSFIYYAAPIRMIVPPKYILRL